MLTVKCVISLTGDGFCVDAEKVFQMPALPPTGAALFFSGRPFENDAMDVQCVWWDDTDPEVFQVHCQQCPVSAGTRNELVAMLTECGWSLVNG